MFTGIIEEVGTVTALDVQGDHARLRVACTQVVADGAVGDSIAVDGCCLTIAAFTDDGFAADLMAETMRATALGRLDAGSRVNLEPALSVGDRLGGHLVQGHVDGVGTVTDRRDEVGTTILRVALPADLSRYVVTKGSITVQGTSLTVVDTGIEDATTNFTVALIPHTLEATTFGDLAVGDPVNLEVDVVAKYVERLLAGGSDTPYPSGPSSGGHFDE
jgi:riboflavin synthase